VRAASLRAQRGQVLGALAPPPIAVPLEQCAEAVRDWLGLLRLWWCE